MSLVVCPHCKSHRLVTSKVPKDVIVVMSCPECQELSVIFQEKVVALDKQILSEGSQEERIGHISKVIAEFLESGAMPLFKGMSQFNPEEAVEPEAFEGEPAAEEEPITKQEIDRFTQIDLKCIDDPAYFKKHFG